MKHLHSEERSGAANRTDAEEVFRRLPPDIVGLLAKKLREVEADPRAAGREIVLVIALDKEGKPTARRSRLQGPWEWCSS